MLIAGRAGDGSCGVGDHALFLGAALAELPGVAVELVYRRGAMPLPHYEPALEGHPRLTLRPLSGFGSEKLGELSALIRELKPDIVHLQYPAAEYRYSTLPLTLALRRKRLRGARLVVTLHEYAASRYLRRLAAGFLARRAQAVITPSAESFPLLARKLAGRLHLIPDGNFFDAVLREKQEPSARLPQLLHFGLPSRTKDYAGLFSLFARLRRCDPALTLLVITSRMAEFRLRLRHTTGGELAGVKFLPHQPLPELRRLAEESLLLLFPFTFDTHRSSLINALSFATPIAAFGTHPAVAQAYAPDLPLAVTDQPSFVELNDYLARLRSDFAGNAGGQLAKQEALRRKLAMGEIAARHLAVYNSLV